MKELDIKISHQCNNNCIFCLNKDKRSFGGPIEIIKNTITLFAEEKGEKLIVSGGEPLISKHFFDIINLAKCKGITSLGIQTNGRMLSYEQMLIKLMEFSPIDFLVSFHFPNSKLYKKYSHSDGFEQVVQGIKNLTKHNCVFVTNTVIMKPNLHHLKKIIALLKELGVSERAQYRFIDGKNVFSDYKKFVPRYSECIPIIREVTRENPNIHIFLREFPICILGEELKEKIPPFLNLKRLNLTTKGEIMTSKSIQRSQFIFPNQCKECIYNNSSCLGIRKEYADVYGTEELKPVKRI